MVTKKASKKAMAERVRMLLARLDITQDELGVRLGVTRQAISGWMTGTNKPHPRRMARFEMLERSVAADPGGAEVDAVHLRGAAELRQWLKAYTDRVLAAQAHTPYRIASPDYPALPAVLDAITEHDGEEERADFESPTQETAPTRRKRG